MLSRYLHQRPGRLAGALWYPEVWLLVIDLSGVPALILDVRLLGLQTTAGAAAGLDFGRGGLFGIWHPRCSSTEMSSIF